MAPRWGAFSFWEIHSIDMASRWDALVIIFSLQSCGLTATVN